MEKEAYCCGVFRHLCDMVDGLKGDLEKNEELLEFFENQPSSCMQDNLYQRFAQVRFLLLKNQMDICLQIGEHACARVASGTESSEAAHPESSSLTDSRKRKRSSDENQEPKSEKVSASLEGRVVHNVHRSSPYLYQELISDPSLFLNSSSPPIQTEGYQKAKKTLTTVIKRIHDTDMVVIGAKGERINVTRYRELMATYKDSLVDGSLDITDLFQGSWTAYNIVVSSKKKTVNVAYVFIPLYALA